MPFHLHCPTDTEAALIFRLSCVLPGCLPWHEIGYHLALGLVTLLPYCEIRHVEHTVYSRASQRDL